MTHGSRGDQSVPAGQFPLVDKADKAIAKRRQYLDQRQMMALGEIMVADGEIRFGVRPPLSDVLYR